MNNTAQHTPAPWVHVNDFEIWDQPGMYAQTIATVDPSRVGNTEAFYNARLIAAAPAILSSLHSAVADLQRIADDDMSVLENIGNTIKSALAAIAQATGNTSTPEQPEEEEAEEEELDHITPPDCPDTNHCAGCDGDGEGEPCGWDTQYAPCKEHGKLGKHSYPCSICAKTTNK